MKLLLKVKCPSSDYRLLFIRFTRTIPKKPIRPFFSSAIGNIFELLVPDEFNLSYYIQDLILTRV